METNKRIKQTARKTTGGKPPSSKKSFFHPPTSGDSAVQQHSDPQRDPVKRKSGHKPTFPDGQTHSPVHTKKPVSRGNTTKTHSPKDKRGEDPDQTNRYAANHTRNDFTWTASTSNIRDGNEEEEDELFSSPSSHNGHSPHNTETLPVAKTKVNVIKKCDRCRGMGSNPVCLPHPGSKKCAKCVRDHRTCSWTAGLSGPSSFFGGNSSLKTGPGNAKKTSSEKLRSASDRDDESVQSNANDPSGQAQQIGPKCTRCAVNANNPICERSDDPKDAKCKKCRRDKQSCSFAPFGKPSTKRKKTISAGAGEGRTDEENYDGEEEEEQDGSVETSLKGKKKSGGDAEMRTGLDSEGGQTRAAGDGNRSESPNAAPKIAGSISSLRSMLLAIAENQRDTSKRKKDADQDDSPREGDRNFSKKKKRPNTTSLDPTIPPASNSNGSPHVANSSFPQNPHGTSGLPGLDLNETGNTSTASSTTTHRVISVPPAVQRQLNGRAHASRHSASVGSPIVTRPIDQRPETVELAQDKSIAVIERELRAAEVKAASHRAIAESYLKDARRAEEDVAKLKEELLTAVRKNTNLGIEGLAAERKLLIEKFLGSGGDQSA